MTEASDGELVRRAQADQADDDDSGSAKRFAEQRPAQSVNAFGELVERHMKKVYALAYSFVHNHSEADDLAQETFLEAFRSLSSFRGRSSFGTWLYRIGLNVCTNYVKRRPAWRPSVGSGRPAPGALSGAAGRWPDPSEAAALGELEARIGALIEALPRKLRLALHLVVYQGLSHNEAAKVMNCPRNTVSWRVFRARQLLRERLGSFEKGPPAEGG